MSVLARSLGALHLPSALVVFLVALVGQFSLGGTPIDLATNEGRVNLGLLAILAVAKAYQAATAPKVQG